MRVSDLHHPVRARRAGERRPRAGFSLIEVLAAFVILALVATALFRLFSASLAQRVAPPRSGAARCWSRSRRLASRGGGAAAAGSHRARQRLRPGACKWETRVAPYDVAGRRSGPRAASETLATRLYRIAVRRDVHAARDGRERTMSLATMRLGRARIRHDVPRESPQRAASR